MGLDMADIAKLGLKAAGEAAPGAFGSMMFGVNLIAGAKDIYDAFDHGKCPLDVLPKKCADQKHLCGKHGKCHPSDPWMCICNDGKTRSSCRVNPTDLVEYLDEPEPTEKELDA